MSYPPTSLDPTPDVSQTHPSDWKYISEGGSSIVFSYTGTHPDFAGTALRLRKVATRDAFAPGRDDDGGGAEEEPDDPLSVFQHAVVQRLVPRAHLPRLDAAHVERRWLAQLHQRTFEQRPLERRAKDVIDVGKRKAVLATDLVGGDGLAVEIKPKWGFLPSPVHLSPDTAPFKTNTCRFCMHAHMKAEAGEDVSMGYCPLDLYSGQPERVTKALHALWDVWISTSGGVNNLKIFVEGHQIKPSADPESLAPLARQLHIEAGTIPQLRDAFTAAMLPLLDDTPLLHTLSKLQRSLDALDVEGLSLLWSNAYGSARVRMADAIQALDQPQPTKPPLGKGMADPTIEQWSQFVDQYLANHHQMDHAHPDIADLQYYCTAYLLSASFKDCSIILRIPKTRPSSITVIDLDVKSTDRLKKWEKLDREIVDAYRKAADPVQCVDQWQS